MSDATKTPFVLPEHLEPYRDLIEAECGGLPVEKLLNDHKTNSFNNSIKATLICMADTKVRLLQTLHERRLLTQPDCSTSQVGEETVITLGRDRTYESAFTEITHLINAANPGQTVSVERHHVDREHKWFTVTVKPYATGTQAKTPEPQVGGGRDK